MMELILKTIVIYLCGINVISDAVFVIKLQKINGRPVAKLSDVKGKTMCIDENYLEYLTRAVEYRIEEEKNLKGKY